MRRLATRGKHDRRLDVGTSKTFSVDLPASGKEVRVERKVEEKALAGHGKILVMDDDEMIQDITCAMLTKLGYEVEVAGNGKEAVDLFRNAREAQAPFDAVLMDLTIPGGMGGEEAIGHLKALDQDVKAIVSSGYTDDPIMVNYRDYGFSGVVVKPYNFQKLSAVLQQVLG